MGTASDAKSTEAALRLLRQHNLRATPQRLAVVRVLAAAGRPLSHSETATRLVEATGLDRSTVYRNLTRLTQAGVTQIVSHANGVARYALMADDQGTSHDHPHFVCQLCRRVSCLPGRVIDETSVSVAWRSAVQRANVQFHGQCPDCRDGAIVQRHAPRSSATAS